MCFAASSEAAYLGETQSQAGRLDHAFAVVEQDAAWRMHVDCLAVECKLDRPVAPGSGVAEQDESVTLELRRMPGRAVPLEVIGACIDGQLLRLAGSRGGNRRAR